MFNYSSSHAIADYIIEASLSPLAALNLLIQVPGHSVTHFLIDSLSSLLNHPPACSLAHSLTH